MSAFLSRWLTRSEKPASPLPPTEPTVELPVRIEPGTEAPSREPEVEAVEVEAEVEAEAVDPVEAPPAVTPPPTPFSRGLDWGAYWFRFDYDYLPNLRPLEHSAGGRQIAGRMNRDQQHILAAIRMMGDQAAAMSRIPLEADAEDPSQPHWANGWLPSLDAMMLYSLIVERRPATYFEMGSGNSTKFVRRAIRDHGLPTRIVSIDPQPRAEIDAICDEVIRSRVEDTDIAAIAARARPGDVVFVDNSHRAFPGSDVTVSLLEWMPALPAGTIFGVHDICLPFDYHPCFTDYFYNEQYLVGMYLLGGAVHDKVMMPVYYAQRAEPYKQAVGRLQDSIGMPEPLRGGAALWLELGPRANPDM